MNNNRKIISIGNNCNVAICLRILGIRTTSYPWDWARGTEIHDIIDAIKLGKDKFILTNWKCFKNINYFLPHDKEGDTHGIGENKFENVTLLQKYERRFQRFFEDILLPNTFMVRFGPSSDKDKIKELQKLLPLIKIIFIENGNIYNNEVYTLNELKKYFPYERDSIFNYLEKYIHIQHSFPVLFENILTNNNNNIDDCLNNYASNLDNFNYKFNDIYEIYNFIGRAFEKTNINICLL